MDKGIQAVVRRHRWLRAMFLVLLAGCCALPAFAAQRVALVMGNGSYQHATHLPNPGSDARLLAETLRGLGFNVTERTDLDRGAMERAVLEFSRQAIGADVALVFFAGHGIQMAGHNYLLPVDAKLEDDLALRVEGVNLDLLLDSVSGASTRLVVLDACRNNPFATRMRMSGANRSVARGLGRVDVAEGGTLIAFSTSPGDVAADGDGRNSPFSTALAQHLKQPGLEIRQVFTRVRADVRSQTANRQTPWENSSLLGDVFLAGANGAAAAPQTPPPSPFDPRQTEMVFWQGTQQANTLSAYRAYKQRYPKGDYVTLADIQIDRLGTPVPVQTPPSVSKPTAQSAPASTAGADANGFVDSGNGVLVDTQTGLEWTQRDNGSARIDWYAAERHCANLPIAGGAWRLPSIDELTAIYDRPGGGRAACGRSTLGCRVSTAFRLNGYWFWSGTRNGSSEAWFKSFTDGLRSSTPLSADIHRLALCVRRRS